MILQNNIDIYVTYKIIFQNARINDKFVVFNTKTTDD